MCEHIFGLKMVRFDIQARAFPSVLYTETVLRRFRLILLHLIVVLCVLFYWVARGHVLAPDPITMRASPVRRVRFKSFLRNSTNGRNRTSTNASDPIRTP
jgi:hypothetical protein